MEEFVDEVFENIPEALEPTVTMSGINEPIVMHEGFAQIEAEGTFRGHGRVILQWLPRPDLVTEIRATDSKPSPLLWNDLAREDLTLHLPSLTAEPLECLLTAITDDHVRVVCRSFQSGPDEMCDIVRCEIPNGPDFYGRGIKRARSMWMGRQEARMGGWIVTVDALEKSREEKKNLRSQRGYALTHTAAITRENEQPFKFSDAGAVLDATAWTLSFARGAWTGPMVVRGYRSDLAVAFDWRRNAIDAFGSRDGWFPETELDVLETVLPGVFELLEAPEWSKALPLAIDFYLGANGTRQVETALVLSHAALELLAWVVLVRLSGELSREGFEKLSGADHHRLLLARCGVPLGIPSELEELRGAGSSKSWDGPWAISDLRNRVVHPAKREKGDELTIRAQVEAMTLGLHYVELVILRVLGYGGNIEPRIDFGRWKGQTRPVPWTQQPTVPYLRPVQEPPSP